MRSLVLLLGCLTLASTSPAQQSHWLQIRPSTSPSPRGGQGMAFDAFRKHTVMFGGAGASGPLNETWIWDGKNWTQRKPTIWPAARQSHQMVWDSFRRRVVLFGGRQSSANTQRNDTWEWDGKYWTQMKPTTSPPARLMHTMAYDSSRRRTVLFGGTSDGNVTNSLNDTWEYDGKNWTQRRPASVPRARHGHAMVYDSARKRTVLFGGADAWTLLNDTWEWDGQNWTQIKTQTSPPGPRNFHGMVHDSARRRTVMYGGNRNITGTWEYDGRNWIPVRTLVTPLPRSAISQMAYDSARQRTVLFGGWSGGSFLNDTWEYAGPRALAGTPSTISIATGGTHRFTLDAGTAHGTRLYWILGSVTGTSPGVTLATPTGPVNVPLNPDFWTDITIGFVNGAFLVNTRGTLDGSGRSSASFLVPKINNSSAIGVRFYHAYLVHDAQNNFYAASPPVDLMLVR